MLKRNVDDDDKEPYQATKKFKGLIPQQVASASANKNHQNEPQSSKCRNFDEWGEDFNDDAMDEIDKIISQPYTQENSQMNRPNQVCRSVNMENTNPRGHSSNAKTPIKPILKMLNNGTAAMSTMTKANVRNPANNSVLLTGHESWAKQQHFTKIHNLECKKPFLKTKSDQSFNHPKFNCPSQILAGSGNNDRTILSLGNGYKDFQQSHLRKSSLNSTFMPQKNALSDNGTQVNGKDVDTLVEENTEMSSKLIEKQGEAENLRRMCNNLKVELQETKANSVKLLEETEKKHNKELEDMNKKMQELKTQNDLEKFGNLSIRCKLIESGHVKLTQPQAVVSDRSRLNLSVNRNEIKNCLNDSKNSSLKIPVSDKVKLNYPKTYSTMLKKMPRTIFDLSLPEKPLMNVRKVEKSGRRNLPILEEEETLRIFENPELVKPLATIIDKKELNLKFHLSDLALVIGKSESEINTRSTTSIINKLVATTRELILNSTIVLQRISKAMTNDDIRDMNEVYFSPVQETPIAYSKNVCDGDAWYDDERGIEARRFLGIMSHLAQTSTYLSKYISGKSHLLTANDTEYDAHIVNMTSYGSWNYRQRLGEFLELILEFVTAVRIVRRAHQFTGLLSAIAMTLSNAYKCVKFDAKGIHYVSQIVKEIVLSRPLLPCYVPLTQLLETFCQDSSFTEELCHFDKTSFEYLLSTMHIHPDGCVLEVYVKEMEHFNIDAVAAIDLASSLISFTYTILPQIAVSWNSPLGDECPVANLVFFIMRLLQKCSLTNICALEAMSRAQLMNSSFLSNDEKFLEDWKNGENDFWKNIKLKQIGIIRKGVRFVNYLETVNSDSKVKKYPLNCLKFIHQAKNRKDIVLGISEKEAVLDLGNSLAAENDVFKGDEEQGFNMQKDFKK